MMWLELITIYLAIGAPFAVSLGWRANAPFAYRKALPTFILWPLVATRRLSQRLTGAKPTTGISNEPLGPEQQAQRATQLALTKLSRALPLLASVADAEQLWQQCRQALEKYIGLTSAVYQLDENETPGPRASELYRLDGLDGADLAGAARCWQRRNAARLKAHQIKARQEFQRALQEAQQVVTNALRRSPVESAVAVYVEELWLGFLDCARQLCLTLQDKEAAPEVTRRLADARANRARPALPAKEIIPPPQLEVEKCTPETNIAFPKLPAGMASRLG